jgi:LacI family transcriptional regulator
MKTPSSAPNLRRIARAARVSHTTVSLALRNHPRVSARVREKIHALAASMGYRPNALVSALMTHVRSRRRVLAHEVVAFLTGGPTRDWWKSWGNIEQNFLGARARAEQLGFRLEPLWMGPLGRDAAATSKVLHARAIRGAVMAPLPVPHEPVALEWSRCAVTALGYSFEQVPLHRATHNHVNSTVLLYRELRALGYRRIGLALARSELERVKNYWLAGVLTGRELHGGERVSHLVFADGRAGRAPFFAWLEKQRPDVVVGVARDTYFWLREAGWRLPQDVAYAHLSLADVRPGDIAGIEQKPFEIGAAAFDLLVSQLYRNEYGCPATPQTTLLDGRWTPGATAPGRG